MSTRKRSRSSPYKSKSKSRKSHNNNSVLIKYYSDSDSTPKKQIESKTTLQSIFNYEKLWHKIGTSDFPGPAEQEYAIKEVKDKPLENQKWCRGYLAKEILTKLIIKSSEEQKARLLNIKGTIEILDKDIEHLSGLLLYPNLDVAAAQTLRGLSVIRV
jgi:hypothetical protein